MPVSALNASVNDLETLMRGPRRPGWLADAIDPLLELLGNPALLEQSDFVESAFLERSVRGAVAHAMPGLMDWPLLMQRAPRLQLLHGSGLVGDYWMVFAWFETLGRGLVMLTHPLTDDTHLVSMHMGLMAGSTVAEA